MNAGDVLRAQPATLRDGGEPVTGTVVKRNSDGSELSRTDYVDGFPTGKLEEWYESGQKKTERSVKLEKREVGSVLVSVGSERHWCENGTPQSEKEFDAEGKPVGRHQEWTCGGKPLLLAEYPAGEFKRWQELAAGDTVLTEEGTRAESGHLVGAHRSFYADGKPMLVEHWKDEQLDGDYERYNADGTLIESGRHAAGKKVGDWRLRLGRDESSWTTTPTTSSAPSTRERHAGRRHRPRRAVRGAGGLSDRCGEDHRLRPAGSGGREEEAQREPHALQRVPDEELDLPVRARVARGDSALRELGADPKAIDSSQRSRLHYCINSLFSTCGPKT